MRTWVTDYRIDVTTEIDLAVGDLLPDLIELPVVREFVVAVVVGLSGQALTLVENFRDGAIGIGSTGDRQQLTAAGVISRRQLPAVPIVGGLGREQGGHVLVVELPERRPTRVVPGW